MTPSLPGGRGHTAAGGMCGGLNLELETHPAVLGSAVGTDFARGGNASDKGGQGASSAPYPPLIPGAGRKLDRLGIPEGNSPGPASMMFPRFHNVDGGPTWAGTDFSGLSGLLKRTRRFALFIRDPYRGVGMEQPGPKGEKLPGGGETCAREAFQEEIVEVLVVCGKQNPIRGGRSRLGLVSIALDGHPEAGDLQNRRAGRGARGAGPV